MKTVWLAAFAALWGWWGSAAAVGHIADISVYDRREDRVLPLYRHEGRYYVAGTPGHEYRVRVRNRTGAEILAVMSVDGVNVVSGETADWSQTGYVLGARDSYDVMGWRKSLRRVAAFFFTRHDHSYAARTGRPDNVGVIGVALFRKQPEPLARLPRDTRPRTAPAESAADATGPMASRSEGVPPAAESEQADAAARSASRAPLADRKIGTGHGRSEASQVTYTSFARASDTPDEVIVIHYDTYRNLVSQGVIPARAALPEPFPGRFVPDPR